MQTSTAEARQWIIEVYWINDVGACRDDFEKFTIKLHILLEANQFGN